MYCPVPIDIAFVCSQELVIVKLMVVEMMMMMTFIKTLFHRY